MNPQSNPQPTDGDEEIERGRYQCPHCPSRFESMGDKRRHLRDSHAVAR